MNWLLNLVFVLTLNALVVVSVGCEVDGTEVTHSDDIRVAGLEFVPCKPDFGGEACVEMAMRLHGNTLDQDFVFDLSGIDPLEGRGCATRELLRAVKALRIDPGEVWLSVEQGNWERQFLRQMEELKVDLSQNVPWIVCLKTDAGEKFMLVSGLNTTRNCLLYTSPSPRD